MSILSLFLIFGLLFGGAVGAEASKEVELKVSAHIHSRFSHGSTEPIDQIAAHAQAQGIDALLLTDTALADWSYGLPMSGGLLEIRRRQDSILKLGPEAYLSEIEKAAAAHPSVILIPGTEPAAFYRWTGWPWSGLVLHDWHRHMLLVGLHQAADYKDLPILGNRQAYRFCWQALWPFAIILLAYCGRKAEIPIVPTLFYILGYVFLINAFPFRCFPWNQYQNATPWAPYQELARYGKSRGALVFLAHPESPSWIKPVPVSGHVSVQTGPYRDGLEEIPDLDGFGVFMEGDKTMSEPGGAWDIALEDYCSGKRSKPVWGIAELDYKGWGVSDTYLDSSYMVVRARSKTEPGILDAIRSGNFYSLEKARSGPLNLIGWDASASGRTADSGQTLQADGRVRLNLALSRAGLAHIRVRVRVIRNGKVIVNDFRMLPARWTFEDSPPGACSVYRVMVRDDENGELASNPIFVRKRLSRAR